MYWKENQNIFKIDNSYNNTPCSSIPIHQGALYSQIFYKNSDITKPATWNKYQEKLELFASRVESCKFMSWASLVCQDCGENVKTDCMRLSCLSPYCRDEECIKNRKRLAMAYFKALKIYSKNLLHIVYGFEHTRYFSNTKQELKKHQKVFNLLKREMQRLGTPLHSIVVRDVSGQKGDLYIHYHAANLPVKDWRKFRQNLFITREKIMKQIGIPFSIKFKLYRRMYGLFKYFSHRVAGVFGDIKQENTYGYANLMSLKEFFDCFYKSRKIKLIGLRAPEGSSVLAITLDNFIQECPYCHSKRLKIVPNGLITKPPPKICSDCGLEASPCDYSFQLSLCRWCSHKTTPEYKMQKIQEKFNKFLDSKVPIESHTNHKL